MREIKFRAWNPLTKKFDYSGQSLQLNYKGIWFGSFAANLTDYLQQYTGLKDKNGKEIYEGDIALLHGYYRIDVRFKNGMFLLDAPTNHGDVEEILYNRLDTCEIIGNIYETPELLS